MAKALKTNKDYDMIQYWLDVWYFYIEEWSWQLYVNTKSKLNYNQLIDWYKLELEREKKRLKELKLEWKKW